MSLKLGIDVDMVNPAEVTPAVLPSSTRRTLFASNLPAYVSTQDTCLTSSPLVQLWQCLRSESALKALSDADLWDVAAFAWLNHTALEKLTAAQKMYSTSCAACHVKTGKGDGVMVCDLPVVEYQNQLTMADQRVCPPDFFDPMNLLGTSPVLLEGKMIRGGMGAGIPYWGPILPRSSWMNW